VVLGLEGVDVGKLVVLEIEGADVGVEDVLPVDDTVFVFVL
jgi:hypothetical protein